MLVMLSQSGGDLFVVFGQDDATTTPDPIPISETPVPQASPTTEPSALIGEQPVTPTTTTEMLPTYTIVPTETTLVTPTPISPIYQGETLQTSPLSLTVIISVNVERRLDSQSVQVTVRNMDEESTSPLAGIMMALSEGAPNASAEQHTVHQHRCTINEDGICTFESLPTGPMRNASIRVDNPCYQDIEPVQLSLPENTAPVAPIELTLDPRGHCVEIEVLDQNEQPVPGQKLTLWSEASTDHPEWSRKEADICTTDEEGTCTFTGVPPELLQIWVGFVDEKNGEPVEITLDLESAPDQSSYYQHILVQYSEIP
jgi:hypothetical protein